ncbi:hypothetical protein [Myroides sp. WP-1]|uniref:hypothetical protein n=1 Tax=Myroides sp. WP-1 TaxID=2759944 RepID=UPI0015FCEEAE|nr:hypothetical protein [Myroides sp. WP-1]MBB1140672.1 hypothetical protein [Myroides sp. WP-1]
MFRLVYKKKDVKASSFMINDFNKYIYINNESNVILIDDEYTIKEYDCLLNSLVTFTLSGNAWVANLITGNTTIYNYDNIPVKTIDFIASSSRYIKNFSTEAFIYPKIYLNRDFKNSLYAKISKSDFNIIENYNSDLGLNGIYLVINDDLFISISKGEIALFNFKNKVLWQHSFLDLMESDEAFLYDKIINIDDKLFFNIAGSSNGGLFCLDVQTGVVLHKYRGFSRPLFQDENFIYTSDYENILCRIDSKTLEIEKWDVNELVKKQGFDNIHDHRSVVRDGVFYFKQTLGDDKAKFGVLDFNTKELLFKYEFEPKNGGVSSIKVGDDRIFVHTQDNTLHIFEKE